MHNFEQLQIISQDDKKRMEYEAREKAIRDYNHLINSAFQQGKEQEFQRGLQALVKSLSCILPDTETIYQAVIDNEMYKDVSKEQVLSYL